MTTRRPVPETRPGRCHVAFDRDGARILDGRQGALDTADRKFTGLQEQHGEHADADLFLTGWNSGQEWPIREWPTPAKPAGGE